MANTIQGDFYSPMNFSWLRLYAKETENNVVFERKVVARYHYVYMCHGIFFYERIAMAKASHYGLEKIRALGILRLQ